MAIRNNMYCPIYIYGLKLETQSILCHKNLSLYWCTTQYSQVAPWISYISCTIQYRHDKLRYWWIIITTLFVQLASLRWLEHIMCQLRMCNHRWWGWHDNRWTQRVMALSTPYGCTYDSDLTSPKKIEIFYICSVVVVI